MADPLPARYKCLNCGHIHDIAEGCADLDVPPGTAWDDMPEDWLCPQCGSDKRDFEPIS